MRRELAEARQDGALGGIDHDRAHRRVERTARDTQRKDGIKWRRSLQGTACPRPIAVKASDDRMFTKRWKSLSGALEA